MSYVLEPPSDELLAAVAKNDSAVDPPRKSGWAGEWFVAEQDQVWWKFIDAGDETFAARLAPFEGHEALWIIESPGSVDDRWYAFDDAAQPHIPPGYIGY